MEVNIEDKSWYISEQTSIIRRAFCPKLILNKISLCIFTIFSIILILSFHIFENSLYNYFSNNVFYTLSFINFIITDLLFFIVSQFLINFIFYTFANRLSPFGFNFFPFIVIGEPISLTFKSFDYCLIFIYNKNTYLELKRYFLDT